MTLTSSFEGGAVDLRKHFQILRKRIEHEYGKKMEYCCISTNEGKPAKISGKHGVLHIVFTGMYINQKWLSRTWEDIHGAKVVYLQKFYGAPKSIAGYLSKYYAHHDDTRLSWSWGWVCRGFTKYWKDFYRFFGYPRMIQEWDLWLSRRKLVSLKQHVFWDDMYNKGQEKLDQFY